MKLSDALDLCTDRYADAWIAIPGGSRGRPATAMLAATFDPGMSDPRPRPLTGHTVAVYVPDARLSIVWPMPEDDDEYGNRRRATRLPEWAETDDRSWKHARSGWAVVLLNGSPIWQEPVWYIDWGSGIGGYVANFRARIGDDNESGTLTLDRWEANAWSISFARLLNVFSNVSAEFARLEPTSRLVPEPSNAHPLDEHRFRHGH
jgi:hypothetical protein